MYTIGIISYNVFFYNYKGEEYMSSIIKSEQEDKKNKKL